MRFIASCFVVGAGFLFTLFASTTDHPSVHSTEVSRSSEQCTSPEYRQFDFWVGDWDAFDVSNSAKIARTRVVPILGGCVLQETYQGFNGHVGESFSIYDVSRKVWHQSWVTNQGELLIIEGRMQDGAMVLSDADRAENGEGSRTVRGFWKPIDGSVRETAETSSDGGVSWKPWFDIVFRAHSVDDDDSKVVAALDKQYQAAVKVNDPHNMDRILADDFVLVTGSGKMHTRSELITEARTGETKFEKNDELEQSVRLWGDTAVVTAKLWEKGTDNGVPFDHILWFSDTYVRTPAGWRYVFGQSSLPLPKTLEK